MMEVSTAEDRSQIIDTDLLIVGTGPAGASLACFLASHGKYGKKTPCFYHLILHRTQRHHALSST